MKKYLLLTVLLLILSNAIWLYKTIDFGTTFTYQQVTLEEQKTEKRILSKLVMEGAKNYSKTDMLVFLRKQNPESFIVEDENRISIGSINFIYENGILVGIE
ncbi:MAG: hypothetical protein GY705_21620 [Bacteroidetes bacterium]|nr:hypothetical protein [Bacteroidota bacterium]